MVIVNLLWVGRGQGLELLGEQFPSVTIEAVVTEVTPSSNVQIDTDSADRFTPGDRVELVYMADLLPMLLGVYEISKISRSGLWLRPVTLMSAPAKGMHVTMVPREDIPAPSKASPPTKTHETQVYGHGDEIRPPDLPFNSTSPDGTPVSVTGTVSEVRGQDIVVTLPHGSGRYISPGQPVEAFLVLSSGQELAAGKWAVSSVQGDQAICSAVGEVRPRKGLKAVFTPATAGTLETFDRTGTLFDPNYKGVQ